jgi:hypothetical protein
MAILASIAGRNPYCCRGRSAVEHGPDHKHRDHLDQTVADSRGAERSLASVALRYPQTQKGLDAYVPATSSSRSSSGQRSLPRSAQMSHCPSPPLPH